MSGLNRMFLSSTVSWCLLAKRRNPFLFVAAISLANLFLQSLPPSRVPWPHSVETLTLLVPKTLQRNLWQRLELVSCRSPLWLTVDEVLLLLWSPRLRCLGMFVLVSACFLFFSSCAYTFKNRVLLSLVIVEKAACCVSAMLSCDCLVSFSTSSCDFFAFLLLLLAGGAFCIVLEWHAAVLVTPFVCTVFVFRCTSRLTSSIILYTFCSQVLSVFCFCLFSPSEWWDERWVKRTQSVLEQVRLGCQFLWVSGERATKHGFCAVFRWFLDPLMESAVPDTWLFPSRRRKYCDLDLVTVDFFLSVWLLAGKNLRFVGLDF